MSTLPGRSFAEAVGTAGLLAVVVGSGIMGQRLGDGSPYLALLANSLATGCGLFALIVAFGPFSGAHFNPVVTLSSAVRGDTPWSDVPAYVAAQFVGAIIGVMVAHAMYELPLVQAFASPRTGFAQWLSEAVATFGLLMVIFRCDASRPWAAPFAVATYITAAYWFTSSTSFANPAVTLARGITGTFSGIRMEDVPQFIVAQLVGTLLVLVADRAFRTMARTAPTP